MVNIILIVLFCVIDSLLPAILILYSEFLHLSYKIELINFCRRIVENTYALLVAVFIPFVAKLSLLILLSAVTRY
jgi:hypothetical protein